MQQVQTCHQGWSKTPKLSHGQTLFCLCSKSLEKKETWHALFISGPPICFYVIKVQLQVIANSILKNNT